jgi:hypothetical protein
MRALSVLQPWASLIIHGTKNIENRTWVCPPAVIGQTIAIHTGLGFDHQARYALREHNLPVSDRDRLQASPAQHQFGVILGVAVVRGVVVDRTGNPWFEGPYGWVLSDVRPIEPFFVKGRQRLWFLTPAESEEVRRRLESARVALEAQKS